VLDFVLQPGRDRSVRRRHPWLLASAIARVVGGAPEAGAEGRVLSAQGEVLGYGHLSPRSKLRVRVFSFGKEALSPGWLEERIVASVDRRRGHPLLAGAESLRLVNAEGDGLPGLMADRFGDVVVVKLAAAGMATRREEVAAALARATGAATGFERADATAARREGLAARQGLLWGEDPAEPLWIREGRRRYRVDVQEGQKTGFYLDQRDSRDLVERLAEGRRVLDLFAYTGGFSVAAALCETSSVTTIESSAGALELAAENLAASASAAEVHLERADAFRFLRRDVGPYDLIIVDPPPLARSRGDVQRAARAYKDLVLYALRRAAPGALLLAFACSHHVGPDLFRKIVFGASLDARRPLRVLRSLGAPADHPVSLDHPEGAYLNGLLLEA